MSNNPNIRKYHKNECISFKSTKGKFGGLSNMAPNYPINFNGIWVRNSEVLYQALRFPDYPEIQKTILRITSPISAKKYGREHINKTRKDWNQCRYKIMKFSIAAKLEHNKKTFSKLLVSTNGFPIVEYSEKDKVWGASKHGDYYIGVNALGRLLMELREQVAKNTFNFEIPNIPNLYLLGKKITLENISYLGKNNQVTLL